MKYFQVLTLFLVAFIPLYPLQLDTRIIFVISALALALSSIFIKNFTQDLQNKSPITIFFLLFLLSSTISTIFSINRERSLFTLLLYFSCFIIFTSIRTLFPDQKSRTQLITYYLLSVTILSVISLYNTLILKYFTLDPTGLSFMWIYYGHNHIANLHLLAIPLAFYLLLTNKEKRTKILFLSLIILFFISLFFSLARSGMLALFVASFTTILFFPQTFKSNKKVLLFIALLFIASVLLFGPLGKGGNFTINKPKIKISQYNSRIVYWNQALSNFKKHPLLGTGLDTFHIVNKKEPRPPKIISADNPHNYFLQQLSDNGILGFSAFLLLIISIFMKAFKTIKDKLLKNEGYFYMAIFCGMLGSMIISMIDPGWRIPYVFFVFWIFTSLILSQNTKKHAS